MGLIKRVTLLVLVVLLTTCVASRLSLAPKPDCQSIVYYKIDPRFTLSQTSLILRSMKAWEDGTGGYLCFAPGNGGIWIVKTDQQPLQRQIEILGAKFNNIKPEEVVGLANYPGAFILTGKLDNDQDFYRTIIHEIGHLLGIDHYLGPEPSWMYPSISLTPGNGARNLTEYDSFEFCKKHGCYVP